MRGLPILIFAPVPPEAGRGADLLGGLERIGIDEISHRKSQRYLTVVVDHDTGRLVWAAAGRDKATVEAFFDAHPLRLWRGAFANHWFAKAPFRRARTHRDSEEMTT